MRYLDDVKLWDKIEALVEWLIFACSVIAAMIKLGTQDIYQVMFYIALAAIIAPFSGLGRMLKRYLIGGMFFLGLLAGYFR
jgi:hypothetical protein